MSKIPENYPELVYAGWLGKIIGVRHGAKIESWTYDRIKRTYGEITGYTHTFEKNFAADDDTNGPVFFLRALDDYTYDRDITAEEMGLNVLNYVPDGHGFFWWGGYGKSTENTAYLNLKNGIMAPNSGSIEQNGATVAEQIGGQIFIDCWGFIAPGQPELAADYAEKMASVTHGGNGIYGGMFIAACIAAAFVEDKIEDVIEAGLSVIPTDCEYATMSRDIINLYQNNPKKWRECFEFVYENYGYDKYPGVCHIIPNSAVIVLSLLYSQGDYSDAINISNMCGWDTDCNVGNVGAIVGVFNGLEGIDDYWLEPINDFLCNSSVIGSLNIMNVSSLAAYTANFGYKITGEKPAGKWSNILNDNSANYHFEFPRGTQSFRVDTDIQEASGFVENTTKAAYSGERSLKVAFDRSDAGFGYRAFIQTYYTPEDFDDNRYSPSFSPILYPGQKIETMVMVPEYGDVEEIEVRLFVRDRNQNKLIFGEKVKITLGEWQKLKFDIPAMESACLKEAGVEFIPVKSPGRKHPLIAYIDDFNFGGKPDYKINFSEETLEMWTSLHVEVSQLSYLRGLWTLEDGELSGSYSGEMAAEAYTGDLNWENYIFEAEVLPRVGKFHNINFRVQGGIRSYAAGLADNQKLTLYKNNNGYTELSSVDFDWKKDEVYKFKAEITNNHYHIYVDDELLIEYTDEEHPYLNGQVGFSNFGGSHTHYKGFEVKGL